MKKDMNNKGPRKHEPIDAKGRALLDDIVEYIEVFATTGVPLFDGWQNHCQERLPMKKVVARDPIPYEEFLRGNALRGSGILRPNPDKASGETPAMYYARGGVKTVLSPCEANLSEQLNARQLGLRIYEGNFYNQR